MSNSSLDTFTLRMVVRKVSPFRRAEWAWVHDHHQNHHEQHVWSPPIIITITTIISDLFTEESRVAMLPIRVFVPDTTALPSFTFFGIILIGLIILIIIVVRVLVPEKKLVCGPKRRPTCAICWPDLKRAPSLRPSPAIASVTSTWYVVIYSSPGNNYPLLLVTTTTYQSFWWDPVSQLHCLWAGMHPVHY